MPGAYGTNAGVAPKAPVQVLGKSKQRGTIIRFWPDPHMFPDTHFDRDVILHRLREMAFLNKGLTLVVDDEEAGYSYTYYFEGGILAFVRHLVRTGRLSESPEAPAD